MSVLSIVDSLRNVVSGLGGRYDKSPAHSGFITPLPDDMEILNTCRGSAIPEKIADIPPFDATRECCKWNGIAEQGS